MIIETPAAPDPVCTFCNATATDCRLMMAAPEDKAFICELCVVEAVSINIRHFRATSKLKDAIPHG